MAGLLSDWGKNNPFYQGFDERRNAIGGFGLGLMTGKTPQEGFANAAAGALQGRNADTEATKIKQEEAKRQEAISATTEWLRKQAASNPFAADMVGLVEAGALTPNAAFAEVYKTAQGGTSDWSKLNDGTLYNQRTGETIQVAGGASGNDETFFGTGIPLKNADGSIVYGQFGNQGSFNIPDIPEGASFLTPVDQLDVGTGFVDVDKFGNRTGTVTAIDNFGAEQDKAMGDAIGTAAAAKITGLGQTIATSDNMMATIDGVLEDPALDTSTGWLAWMQGAYGTDQYRFGQRALQLQGQAFLQAFDSLRNAGQITEIEGTKATQAIGRLSTAQSPPDYRAALSELKGIIGAAKQRAISGAAAVELPGNSALSNPGVDYRNKYGLE